MMNRVQLIGNVGKDIQHGTDKNGSAWAKFSLATQKKVKEEFVTTWHSIVAFGRVAEHVIGSCSKGVCLYVGGALNQNKFEKDGQIHHRTQIIATEVYLLSRLKKSNEITEEQSNSISMDVFGDEFNEHGF